jgi:hypothetical protein
MTTEETLLGLKGSIALVGNGMIHRRKADIDKFDQVIRFNSFNTETYGKHIGEKTTVWCTYGFRVFHFRLVENLPWICPFEKDSLEVTAVKKPLPGLRFAVTPKEKLSKIYRPTTGGLLVCLCVYLKIPVTLFAFDGLVSGHVDGNKFDKTIYFIHHQAETEFSNIVKLPGVTVG